MSKARDIKMEVMEVHNLFWESYARRDIELRFSLCSEDVTFIGSGLHERALNKSEYEKINKEGVRQFPNPFQIEFLWTNLSMLNEIVACVESEVVWSQMINDEMIKELLRNTTLLKRDNNKWLVTHVHGSVPDYRLKEGDYMTNEQTIIRNRELERQVFERTRDLNKTLEELELKNRELEIEAALEKVRTIAMGMREPADMLDVCKTISLQLQSLGVKEIRNVQTAIFYEQRGTYMNYEFYAKHDKTFITETVFTNNEIHNDFATKMLRGKGETFITHIKGSKVKDWVAYQKTTNVFIDKYLETASSLNYYWFSLGPVALGISTYVPLTEDEINLFKRFLKVFELAYQRYLDIEQAIAQAREAQIEASLERVRAVAMGMNKSDDLLRICEVSFKEFGKLGFDNIRNALVHIQYDEQKYFMDYDFSDLTGGAITKIEYGSHPVVEDYLNKIRSAKDAFYQGVIKEDQLEEWKNFRRNSGQIDDPRLDKATALYYYFFSIGIGDIGISTLEPINESQIKILKRFRNVFDLAYRRYTDITRAEAQAREAKIEAALERVRSRSLAMHKSDEIKDVVVTVMEKMNELKIEMNGGVSLATFIEGSQDLLHWYVNPSHVDGPVTMHLPYFDNILFHDFIKARNEGNELLPVVYSFEQKNKYFEYAFEHSDFRIIHEELKKWILEQPYFGYSVAIQKHSAIFFNDYTGKLFSEKENEVLIRFAKVFDQAYIRFLDLQKSEAQARESQIQLALERVRARTMAMQKSDELKEVVASMFDGMKNLGVDPTVCNIALVDRKTCDTDVWTAHQTDNGMITYKVFISHFEHPFRKKLLESFLNEISFSVHELSGDLKKSYAQYLFEHVDYSNVPAEVTKSNEELANMEDGIVLSAAYMKYGLLIVSRNHAISNDESDILQRFAKIFEQTYTRFLDLQKAEAQAKEAQIEVALERVRSQSMGMQSSKDFSNVTTEMFNQLRQFGGDLFATGIVFCDKHDGHVEQWHSLPDAGMLSPFIVPVNLDYIHQYRYDQWKKGVELFEIEIPGDFIEQHFNDIFNLPTAQKVLKDFEDQHTPMPETPPWEIDYGASFKHGYILVSSLQPFKEAEILPRFAKVFEQTYTRFLDLQKAEAQAREAQIEAALERVRSRTMGMQKSVELKDVIRVVYEQFVHLKINVDHAGFVVDYTPKGDWHFWIADEQDIPSKITHPYFESVWANQFNEAKEKGADFFATNLNFEEKNKFYNELLSYVPGIPEASKDFYLSCPGLAATTVLFDNVSLYIENFSGTPYSDEENKILMRFGKVFQQTYTRFLDLQKAEAQAREAQIEASLERVRSKALAMHSPNDLSETVNVFFKELKTLGIIPIRCGVGQIDEATRTTSLTTTTSSQQGESFRVIGKVKQTGHPVLDGIFNHWKLQKEYHPVLEGEDIKAYYNVMNPQIGYPEYPEGVTQYGNNFFFKEGFVFAWTENLLSEEELIIFRRFTSVISLTYRRYLDLKEAEERNKIIQAENDRKTKELEEARQLQLSMLPKKLPQLPNLDIAVYMKTATEVGGDYYDFNVQENGVLNIGFGDATGHGLQAGTMITLMKGFFTSDAARFSPPKFLENCNGLIRDIKLGRILMSFSHLRFENNSLLMSSAGMPPIYYHHKINNRTEEIIIQGLPLGALQSASYKLVEKQLNTGDTILLLTDGLPEQMNSQKVIFDYSRVLKYFDEIADNSPQDIINRLVEKADDWMNGQQQTDDITFVVIKVK